MNQQAFEAGKAAYRQGDVRGAMEALSQALAANSRDHAEGVAAFFEKREHSFTGE